MKGENIEKDLEKYDWTEINKKLDKAKFSIIGCTLPFDIEGEIKEIMQMVINQVYRGFITTPYR